MRGRSFASTLVNRLIPLGVPGRAGPMEAAADGTEPLHDPPLEPRDEAVMLLNVAAEIEHALMVQYLFAGYSVKVAGESQAKLRKIQNLLFQVAREEMGHLATVQNLLHLIGGPLSFNREHSPFASELYPFRFRLERLSGDSLAKYVMAESPHDLPEGFPEEERALLEQLAEDAKRSTTAGRSTTSAPSSPGCTGCSWGARTASATRISGSTASRSRPGTPTGASSRRAPPSASG